MYHIRFYFFLVILNGAVIILELLFGPRIAVLPESKNANLVTFNFP